MLELIPMPIINEKLIEHKEIVIKLTYLLEKAKTSFTSEEMFLFWSAYLAHFGADKLYNIHTGIYVTSNCRPYVYNTKIVTQFNQLMEEKEKAYRRVLISRNSIPNQTSKGIVVLREQLLLS
jgi:hypothetical protein